jgi:hypothetical protein
MNVGVKAADRNFMQERFPNMRGASVDQRHVRSFGPSKAISEPGGEFQTAGSPSYDHDAVHWNPLWALVVA